MTKHCANYYTQWIVLNFLIKFCGFKGKQEVINSNKLINIVGGVSTSSSEILSDGNGNCQQVDKVDEFEDCNGDGIWNDGESGTISSTVVQVACK